MKILPGRIRAAFLYALAIWGVGFVWGMIVFMTPALAGYPSLSGISKFPAVSAVMLLLVAVLLVIVSRRHFQLAQPGGNEGARLGLVYLAVNSALDLLVYWGLFGSQDYFGYASIWLSYVLLVSIPWLVGRTLGRETADRLRAAPGTPFPPSG